MADVVAGIKLRFQVERRGRLPQHQFSGIFFFLGLVAVYLFGCFACAENQQSGGEGV